MALTQVQPGMLASDSQYTGFKSRIINGGMVIDQRNAGASVSVSGGAYTLDRWVYDPSASLSWFTFQQNGGAVTPPAGFSNYLGITSTGANTPTSGQFTLVSQYIEGFNFADLDWGTANAKTITLSFWVRSSLTGTFGGALGNSAFNRSYPFTYTISAANTWEQKSITVAGDTTGTWVGATNGIGLRVIFGLGVGSNSLGTAGAWAGATYRSATGATNVSATNGATFYITGVQLEKGSTATSFDYRPYGTELALCQRYFEKSFAQGTAPAEGVDNNFQTGGVGYAGNGLYIPNVGFKVTKRTTATVTIYRPNVVATNGNFAVYNATTGAWNSSTTTVNSANDTTFSCNLTSNITQDKGYAILGAWTASAEL